MKRLPAFFLLLCLLTGLFAPDQRAASMFTRPETAPGAAPLATSSLRPLLAPADACGYSTLTDDLLAQVSYSSYVDWIEKLSGMEPVSIDGKEYTITTRASTAMFNPINNDNAKAYEYIRSLLLGWYPASQVEDDPYLYGGYTWKNLVLTIPGTQTDMGSVLLTAHLDDAPASGKAPGADDNATGVAALLEAARVLKDHPLRHTVRIIWFSGEEQWLRGSAAYAIDHPLENVLGVINLDMFGFDGDGDRCVELHVGTLPASDFVGRCIQQSISAFGIDLRTGYIDNASAITASDHASFWNHSVGAVEIGENFDFYYPQPDLSCPGADETPYYHTSSDTLAHMHPAFAFDVTRAALAAVFSLGSLPVRKTYIPLF